MTTPLTPADCAHIAHCHPETIRRACINGSLTAARMGNNWMIAPDSLQRWIDGRKRLDGRMVNKRRRLIARMVAKVKAK
jgi:hypothetical protein